MPPLFEASRSAWQAQAEKTGARYHLWNPAEVESLIKAMTPQFWGLYVNLRFPHIQRCDIGRLIILFCCGGLYADLDVMPNRESYMQVDFAVCRIDRQDYRIEKERSPAKKENYKTKEHNIFLDMEVIIAAAGSAVLVRWLEYIQEQIDTTDYSSGTHYDGKRMRYVLQTTGPYAMPRFLKLREQRLTVANMTFIECNVQKEEKNNDAREATNDAGYFARQLQLDN